jgi:hypothetical protein
MVVHTYNSSYQESIRKIVMQDLFQKITKARRAEDMIQEVERPPSKLGG